MSAQDAVTVAFDQERARVLATLIHLTGDWDLAEECVQDAFEAALRHWPGDGIPRRPGAWLTTTARNRALDRLRRGKVEEAKLKQITDVPDGTGPDDADGGWGDERLRLIFTCCHPALSLEARVALTLRTVAGLSTDDIARAFGTPTPTMAQRLTRAKRKIQEAGIPYRVPAPELLPERLTGVLAVVYLLFNQGYSGLPELEDEAIRLGRLLEQLMPAETEVRGLLALMLLHNSRAEARTDGAGDLIPLEEQDRGRWRRPQIEQGVRLLSPTLTPYQLQAAVAATHATAATAQDTDWPRIAALYGHLAELTPSPFIELNRAVAVAMADGPQAGLMLLDTVDTLDPAGRLAGYHLLPATRADLLRRLGRWAEAAASYEQALALAPSERDRRYLRRRLGEVRG